MNNSFQNLTASRLEKKGTDLNLIALMDIFTVLVFFLLFNVHEEQSVNMGTHISHLPLSTQAEDELKEESDVQVLELPSLSQAYFAGQEVTVSDSAHALSGVMHKYCEARTDNCRLLAIEAPPEMPYSFVNQFVELGRSVGFDKVYLVVTQK